MSAKLSNKSVIFLLSLLLIVIGLYYSGVNFLTHISDGIPANPVSGGVVNMIPGDHHEQFYRYSIVYENLLRGRFPYYAGYQFASTEYHEGLVFFPFSAIVGLMSFVFYPVFSYNLLIIFSYVFVGLAGFLMVRQLTKSTQAGIISGIFLATLPFRTSFLYGEMVYGVDAAMIPLLIYFIERAKETRKAKEFFAVGVIIFLTLTSNFQLFYWAMVLLFPYFMWTSVAYIRDVDHTSFVKKMKPLLAMLPGLVATLIYTIFIYRIMMASSLSGGQDFAEAVHFAPHFNDLFSRFSGNEKNVYFGVTAFAVLPWLFTPIFNYESSPARSPYIPLFFTLFIIGLMVIFGPSIDKALNISLYKFFFEYFPGANGTRTTGRVMSVVAVFYAILLGYFIQRLVAYLDKNKLGITKNLLSAGIGIVIIFDFNYLNPIITILKNNNNAYSTISGGQKKIINLPFELNSANYKNATFLNYALKYDLRIFTGHSSFYPKEINEQVKNLFSINDGVINPSQYKWLIDNNYEYLVAHATSFEPNVPMGVIAALSASSYLKLVTQDDGIFAFKILKNIPNIEKKTPDHINFDKWVSTFLLISKSLSSQSDFDPYSYGWYTREVYSNQIPFRWMKKSQSFLAINQPKKQLGMIINFQYHCPKDNENLKINVYNNAGVVTQEPQTNGWIDVNIKLENPIDNFYFIQIKADSIFISPPDIRKFGCQVSDLIEKIIY